MGARFDDVPLRNRVPKVEAACHRISRVSVQGCNPACVTINRVKPETPELNPRLAKRTKRLYSGYRTRWARLPTSRFTCQTSRSVNSGLRKRLIAITDKCIRDVLMKPRESNDPKRRIAPSERLDEPGRAELAMRLSYIGSALHKTKPGDYGFQPPVNPRATKSTCDGGRTVLRAEAQALYSPWYYEGNVQRFFGQ
jgi:hypothetical protein